MTAIKLRFSLLCVLCLLPPLGMGTGCAPRKTGKHLPPLSMPAAFSMTGPAFPDRWWTEFNDPALTELINTALSGNLGIRGAWARLDQARALTRQAASALWPSASLSAGSGKTRGNTVGPPPEEAVVPLRSNVYSASTAAAFEVDLWGRVSAAAAASEKDARAARLDLFAMAVSIAAETTETWLNLAAQNVLLSLYQKQLSVNETDLSLVKLRFGRGLGSALDVYQQRQQVAAAKAKIPGAMQMRDILKHKLAVLCGHPPRLWEPPSPKSLPDMPALPKTGLPADLLQRRPDVEAARLRVAAAEFRAGAAAAARFPTVRLTADTGFQTARSYLFFEQWVWEILGNLSATLFDAGKKAAEVERTQAVVTERLMDYAETALNAVREVEDALTGERFLRQYYDRLENQVRYAEATLEEARFRYVNGLSDYLTVLTYVKALQSLQTSLVMADRDLLVNRVRLYRALGGAWPETLERAPRVRLKSLEVNP